MSLAAIMREMGALEKEWRDKSLEWVEEDKRLRGAIEEQARKASVAEVGGLSSEQIDAAEKLVLVSGRMEGESQEAIVRDAVRDIATGPTVLRTRYMGAKDYARWRGQRTDSEYGYGPRHGLVIFRIELRKEARQAEWTEEERDLACRYVLAKAKSLAQDAKRIEMAMPGHPF